MAAQIEIATYLDPLEAEIARGLLESEGIPASLADENLVRMNWSFALAVGGVRLLVPPEAADAARAVLERQRNGEYEQALEQETGIPQGVCERCGSRSFQPVHSAWWILLLVLSFGLAMIFPPPRKGVRCRQCRQVQLDAL